jgi:cytochrome b subunit of formate dehydrogenase
VISEIDQDKFMNEITIQCGSCHQKLSETYKETYHGKAYLLGDLKAARCSDCHGAHKILKVENPESKVGYKNIVTTCKQCHANANLEFTGYLTHATHNDNKVLFYAFWGMTILLVSVFAFFGLHTLIWLPQSLNQRKKNHHKKPEGPVKYYRRFNKRQRFTHLMVILSFLLLALTGMTLKFAHMEWATFVANLLGGVKAAGNIHRFAAVITFGYFTFHLLTLFQLKAKAGVSAREFMFGKNSLMFSGQDIKDLGASIKWFFGLGPRPEYGRWTYWEKFDYMAVFWGVAVIGFSGLILWFPEFFTLFFPGWVINVAQIIHSDEALLATGFIFTIHFFNTHLRPESFPMDTVIFTGHVPLEEYKKDRPREYQELVASGKLDSVTVTKEFSKPWLKTIRFFGFLFLSLGIIMVILIVYSLLMGVY